MSRNGATGVSNGNGRKPEVTRLAVLNTATKIVEISDVQYRSLDEVVADIISVASSLEHWVNEVLETDEEPLPLEKKAESPAPVKNSSSKPSSGRNGKKGNGPTQKQLNLIRKLCEEKGFDYDDLVSSITSVKDASELIDDLMSR